MRYRISNFFYSKRVTRLQELAFLVVVFPAAHDRRLTEYQESAFSEPFHPLNDTHLDPVEVALEQPVDDLLELGREVEPLFLQPGGPLQPELDALAQRRLALRGLELFRRVGDVLEDAVVVLLVVLDAVFLKLGIG